MRECICDDDVFTMHINNPYGWGLPRPDKCYWALMNPMVMVTACSSLSACKWTACCLRLKCSVRFKDPLQIWYCQWSAVHGVPLRMARSGAIALWCQTVMSRVQGNTINTMARISLLFGISRIGYVARHYLEGKKIYPEISIKYANVSSYLHRTYI